MKTSAGSPLPYRRYWTWMPSGATAMCGVPSGGGLCASPVAGTAAAGDMGVTGSFRPQATTSSAAASAGRYFCMRRTLGERRRVVTDGERRCEARTLDAEQVHESGQAV